MNKLFQQLTNQVINQNPVINMFKQISNPQDFVNKNFNSPQIQDAIKKYGTPENAVRTICRQNGMDVDSLINQIKQTFNL